MDLIGDGERLGPAVGPGRTGRLVQRLRRHPRRLAAGLAVLVVAVSAWGLRWWTHPDLFGAVGGNGPFTAAPQPVGRSRLTFEVIVAPGPGSPTTVTFRGTPVLRFASNSAHATVTFGICHRPQGAKGIFVRPSGGSGNYLCTRIDPIVAGTTFHYPTPAEEVVATLRPTTPGRIVVTGADLDYSLDGSHWYRHGVDHVSLSVVLRATSDTR